LLIEFVIDLNLKTFFCSKNTDFMKLWLFHQQQQQQQHKKVKKGEKETTFYEELRTLLVTKR